MGYRYREITKSPKCYVLSTEIYLYTKEHTHMTPLEEFLLEHEEEFRTLTALDRERKFTWIFPLVKSYDLMGARILIENTCREAGFIIDDAAVGTIKGFVAKM
jgi:hypothetical protein